PNGTELARGRPAEVSGVTTIPVPLIGVENVRRLPSTGSLVSTPAGLKLGRPGWLVPPAVVPTVSAPVRIVNGWPDCHSVDPASCQPPKIWRSTALSAVSDFNQGIS